MPVVVRSDAAAEDLIDIWLYVAGDDPLAADALLDRLGHACDLLAEHPEMGRDRQELARGLRSHPVGRYVILYRSRPEGIEVARVLSGYRDIDALF